MYSFLHSAFDYNDCDNPQKVFLHPGKYLFEVWGASGGGVNGGNGGYTSGVLSLTTNQTFYIFVGGMGEESIRSPNITKGGCNGGGNGGGGAISLQNGYYFSGSGGGGSTDIRTSGFLSNFDDRIIVAGGGGGSCGTYNLHGSGGSGGGINGGDSKGSYNISKGGSQNNGYEKGNGQDGRNGGSYDNGAQGNGGGGGGWYGGFSYQGTGSRTNSGGGGGSSYISGHPGCNSHPIFVFKNTKIFSGKEFQPPLQISIHYILKLTVETISDSKF